MVLVGIGYGWILKLKISVSEAKKLDLHSYFRGLLYFVSHVNIPFNNVRYMVGRGSVLSMQQQQFMPIVQV